MRFLLGACALLALAGCTANDKDYMRNHVVQARPVVTAPAPAQPLVMAEAR